MLVLSHVDEHLTARVHVLSLHNEALARLDRSATLRIDDGLPVRCRASCLLGLELVEHLGGFRPHLPRLDLLIQLHQLLITVLF